MSELQLFLEGSALVGGVALSPAPRSSSVGRRKNLLREGDDDVVPTVRSVQEIRDPEMLRQVAVLLERENTYAARQAQ